VSTIALWIKYLSRTPNLFRKILVDLVPPDPFASSLLMPHPSEKYFVVLFSEGNSGGLDWSR
jgi:hypothetical protein